MPRGRPPSLIEIGSRYHRLTAVENVGIVNTHLSYKFLCDCGTYKTIASSFVRRGLVTSCGCRRIENWQSKCNPKAVVRAVFNRYRINAINKGIPFRLSRQEFYALTGMNCFYCNAPPKLARCKARTTMNLNGLDRQTVSLGYTMDNVVPCCWTCNRIKSDSTHEEFIAWVNTVACLHS